MNEGLQSKAALPDGRFPEMRPTMVTDPGAMRARIQELENLCAEVYVAAVELGLPQPLLNRLWTVAAKGSTPHTWAVEMPTPSSPPAAKVAPVQLPDIKLTDRPCRDGVPRVRPAGPELKPLQVRRRVMVVDDDPMMMEVLIRILQRENFDLITALSGPEALEKADAVPDPVDLLITDYAMPVMKGHELAEHMRSRYPSLRVLYQTGFSDMLFENKAELEDNSAFLEKPFTARGLREAARFILFGALNPA